MNEREARDRIAHDLLALGVHPGGSLLVHSSLSSLGPVPGGPETVVRGLLTALGPEGTLLMPALTYANVTRAQPVFDVLHTPSCVGAIPEHFRTREGSRRSIHPTHSVCALGPGADQFLEDHQQDGTPCGPHSPFRRLRAADGQILFLGCGMGPNTCMHAIEEVAEAPYLFEAPITYRMILADRGEISYTCRRHGFHGYKQRYERLGTLLDGDRLRVRPVLAATAHLVDCGAMWERALEAFRHDPFFFVERHT